MLILFLALPGCSLANSPAFLPTSVFLLVPPLFANSVPEHGVLVDLPQRVGDLHGLAVPRMRMCAKGLLAFFPASSFFFPVTTQEFHMQPSPAFRVTRCPRNATVHT